MSAILIAVAIVTGVGVLCGVMLVIASKFMGISVDEKESRIRECLPGANCGACGFSGCDGYAKALASDSSTATNLCVPGADAVSRKISEILDVGFEDVIEKVAFVHCNGTCDAAKSKHNYEGIQSCSAAKLLYGGQGACVYGCIGFGDCAAACPENAICIENGIAHVDTRKCMGCGLCASKCPNGLIKVMPDTERVVVACSNREKGAVARKKCSNGCIGCKKCELNCPSGAIHVVDNLAEVDYDKCTSCGLCAKNCPVNCIVYEDFSGTYRFVD